MKDQLIVVAGGGGFIGGHLVADFRTRIFEHSQRRHQAARRVVSGVRRRRERRGRFEVREACRKACAEAAEVYNLAADMGGMGFIENNKALCMLSVLINTHLLMAAKEAGVERFFYRQLGLRLQRRQAARPERCRR